MDRSQLMERARRYAQLTGLELNEELGAGVHGIVFAAVCQAKGGRSAIKVFVRGIDFRRERNVYQRLSELGIRRIRGCNVPRFLGHDDELQVIEMTVVTRPFVLDFAGAYLDVPPDFSDEVMTDWRAEKAEQFERHWPEVQSILGALEDYGIYMVDVNPGNISFGDAT